MKTSIREQITSGDLTAALAALHKHGVPLSDQRELQAAWGMCISLDILGYGSTERLDCDRQDLRRRAMDLLDKYDTGPNNYIPLQDLEAVVENIPIRDKPYDWKVLIPGVFEGSFYNLSKEVAERLAACWNACKRIPTSEISLHPEPLFKLGSLQAERQKLAALADAIRPVLEFWPVRGGFIPGCLNHGKMDALMALVVAQMQQLGLHGSQKVANNDLIIGRYIFLSSRVAEQDFDGVWWPPNSIVLLTGKKSSVDAFAENHFSGAWIECPGSYMGGDITATYTQNKDGGFDLEWNKR